MDYRKINKGVINNIKEEALYRRDLVYGALGVNPILS